MSYPLIFGEIGVVGGASIAGNVASVYSYQSSICRTASFVSHGDRRFTTVHVTFLDANSVSKNSKLLIKTLEFNLKGR